MQYCKRTLRNYKCHFDYFGSFSVKLNNFKKNNPDVTNITNI